MKVETTVLNMPRWSYSMEDHEWKARIFTSALSALTTFIQDLGYWKSVRASEILPIPIV